MDRFLKTHPAYSRVFQPGSLTFGFIAPLEGYPNSPAPTLTDHIELARQADRSGFSAIWLRDVPFLDPGFGDVGQIIEPFVYAGMLAAHQESRQTKLQSPESRRNEKAGRVATSGFSRVINL